MTTTPSPNDSRTTSMHLRQHPSTMRNPHHYLGLGQNFKSIRNNTVTTQHGIASLLQNFMRQCVNGIGTRSMDTLLRQKCAQTNGFQYHQIHDMVRALSIPMHLQRHPEPEVTTSQRRSTSPWINQHDCRFRRIPCLNTTRTRSRITECHVRQLQEFCNDQMRQTRSHPYGHRHRITQHRTIPHPGVYLPQPRATALLTRP